MKIRVLALALAILAFFIFVGSPFGQAVNAVAVASSALIAIIIAALAAVGITFATTGQYSSLNEYVSSLLSDFALDSGTTVSNLINGTMTGTDKLGRILVNNRFVVLIQTFATYLIARFSLSNNSSYNVVSSSASVGGIALYTLPFMFNGAQTNRYEQIIGDAYIFLETTANSSKNFWVIGISNSPNVVATRIITLNDGRVFTTEFPLDSHVQGSSIYSTRFGEAYPKSEFNISSLNMYPSGTLDAIKSTNLTIVGGADYDIDISTGVIVPPYSDSDYENGDGAIIDIGAEWGLSYPDVIGGIEDGFSDSNTLDPTITYESEEEVSEQVEDTESTSISQNLNDYQVSGLASVFPFCIPFDIYNFFDCLAADPVAPSFEWRFYVPGICDETIELDLSEFDTVAQIVRTMELLAFIVGLAFVTRDKMIKG